MLQRVGRTVAAIASIGSIAYLGLMFHRDLAEDAENLGRVAIATVMMLVSLVGWVIAWYRQYQMMYVVFVLQFLPMGLYLLGTPRGMWIGLANLLYLLAAIQLHVAEALERRGTA